MWKSGTGRFRLSLDSLSPIYLTGFMGAGKSTAGPLLARILKYEFVDADHLFEPRFGTKVDAVFKKEGEGPFREKESQVLQSFSSATCLVVALGGGVVLRKENREFLRKTGRWVYLVTGRKTLAERLSLDPSPHRFHLQGLAGQELDERIGSLLLARTPYYEEAQFHIQTDALTPEQVAQETARALTAGAIDPFR